MQMDAHEQYGLLAAKTGPERRQGSRGCPPACRTWLGGDPCMGTLAQQEYRSSGVLHTKCTGPGNGGTPKDQVMIFASATGTFEVARNARDPISTALC